jgi:hypothetical protein
MVSKAKRPRRSLRPKSNQLITPQLPPVPVESNTEQSRGVVASISDGIKNLFGNQPSPSSLPVEIPSNQSADSSTASSIGDLTAEQESKLAALPATIGDSPDAVEPGAAVVPDADEAAEIALRSRLRELADEGPIDEEMVGELAADLFEHLAEKYGSTHWLLKPKQRERLALPATACANSCVQRIFEALPDAVGESASAHPEWAALLLAVGSVAAPRVMKQMKLAKEKQAAQKPNAAQPGPSGAVYP